MGPLIRRDTRQRTRLQSVDGGDPIEDSIAERVAAIEDELRELRTDLDRATNRDIPLLKGTIRSFVDGDIESIHGFPDAGRTFRDRVESLSGRVADVEDRIEALGDIRAEKSTKEQKYAAVLAYAANKRSVNGQRVAVTADEIQGCVGVSRRYAYDLIDAMAADVTGASVRESTVVETGSGAKRKKKALLVDTEQVQPEGRR